MALVIAADVKAWVQGDGTTTISGVNDSVLTECIAAAWELIVEETARIWEQTAITEVLSGSDADGPSLNILRLRSFPVLTSPAITVSEGGTSLVVSTGYSLTAGVIVKGAGLESPCRLYRQNADSWAAGINNVSVGYTAGFASIPSRIKFVAKELAWLIYQQGRKTGVDSVSESGSSRSLITKLSEMSQRTLADARRW